ncbi:hypothetical protein [Corynebacterium glyciniphilum]|uniref:hypothetical protein n=1 Tax=Corynebacterium glyciniphilum TaxID=1404244 RepID=UPI003FD1979E
MERRIDFSRERQMLCGGCGCQFVVDLDWIDRWEQVEESCPGCGLTCEHGDAPRVTVDPDDPGLEDDKVATYFWYHTSTQPDWPTRNFDPAADLTPETRKMMGGDEHVAAWAARQGAKALHVGTYEAAVHNMLRRMHDQADRDSKFYLYRVHLKRSAVVREGWLIDPSNWLGDVVLDEVCPPGVNVARYLNYHEDPGGLSLALGRDAIAGVQRVAIPISDVWDDGWVGEAVATLESASDALIPVTGKLGRFTRPSSPRAGLGLELNATLAARLPANLRGQFTSAAAFSEREEPAQWARRVSGLYAMIADPACLLSELDGKEHRDV